MYTINLRAAAAAVAIGALISVSPALAQDAAFSAAEAASVATSGLSVAQNEEGVANAVSDPGLARDARDGSLDVGGAAMGLPVRDGATATRVNKSVVIEGSSDGTAVVAQSLPTGARAMVTIANADAPERYAFPITGVSRLEVMPDGSVLGFPLDAASDSTADTASMKFAPPWAKDATGRDIATRYEIEGTTLVQVVEHKGAEGVVYPLTADPTVTERVAEYHKLWMDWKAYRESLEDGKVTGVVWRDYWMDQSRRGPVRSRPAAARSYVAWRDYVADCTRKIPGAKNAERVYSTAYVDWNNYLTALKAFHVSVDWGSGWKSTTAKVTLGLTETRFIAGLPASQLTSRVVKQFLGKGVIPWFISKGVGFASAQAAKDLLAATTGIGSYRCAKLELTYKHPWAQVFDALTEADLSVIEVNASHWLCR